MSDSWQIADVFRGHLDADAAREVMARGITTHWRVTQGRTPMRPLFVDSSSKLNTIGSTHRAETAGLATIATLPGPLRTKPSVGTGTRNNRVRSSCEPRPGLAPTKTPGSIRRGRRDSTSLAPTGAAWSNKTGRPPGDTRDPGPNTTQVRILADEGNALPPVYATRVRLGRRRRHFCGPRQPRSYSRILSHRSRLTQPQPILLIGGVDAVRERSGRDATLKQDIDGRDGVDHEPTDEVDTQIDELVTPRSRDTGFVEVPKGLWSPPKSLVTLVVPYPVSHGFPYASSRAEIGSPRRAPDQDYQERHSPGGCA